MREPGLRLLLLLSLLALASPTRYLFSSALCLFVSRCNFVRGVFWASFFAAGWGPKESGLREGLPRSTRCLAQEVPQPPQVKAAGPLVGRERSSPSALKVLSSGPALVGGLPWISQGPLCGTPRSRTVIGLPIATAMARRNTISSSGSGCTRRQQVQRLSCGVYNRLSPSFLGSLLLTIHSSWQPHRRKQLLLDEELAADATNSSTPEQHQQSGTPEEIFVYARNSEDGADGGGCRADDYDQQAKALGKGSRCTLREELLEVRLQQLLQQQLLPEIAITGRSNVGKSALLNSFFRLCSSNASTSKFPHARTSRIPGRTQAIDFYLFSFAAAARRHQAQQRHQQQQHLLAQQGAFVIADVPGYGFTKGVSQERAHRISRTLDVYIQRREVQRQQLHQVLLLIDGRRGMGPQDASLLGLLLKRRVQTALVVTKEDKIDAQQMMVRLMPMLIMMRILSPLLPLQSMLSCRSLHVQDLVQCLSEYKQLLLPSDLLQVRMQLLRRQHQKEGGSPCQNNSSCSRPHSPAYPLHQDPFLSAVTAKALLQPHQDEEQQKAKQSVPVFVVSARTGTAKTEGMQGRILRRWQLGDERGTERKGGTTADASPYRGKDKQLKIFESIAGMTPEHSKETIRQKQL
ncbi:hypothetical protein ACSSS7_005403 [Eimeria intestinalis]